jgi:transposase
MEKTYRPYDPVRLFLLPPALQDWLPEDPLVDFLSDVVDQMDRFGITVGYAQEARGYPSYYPRMMAQFLLYAYTLGVPAPLREAMTADEGSL